MREIKELTENHAVPYLLIQIASTLVVYVYQQAQDIIKEQRKSADGDAKHLMKPALVESLNCLSENAIFGPENVLEVKQCSVGLVDGRINLGR